MTDLAWQIRAHLQVEDIVVYLKRSILDVGGGFSLMFFEEELNAGAVWGLGHPHFLGCFPFWSYLHLSGCLQFL